MNNNQDFNQQQNPYVDPKQQKAEKMQQRHRAKNYKKVKRQTIYVPPQWGPNGPIEQKPRKILDLSRVGKFGLWWTLFVTLFIAIYGLINIYGYGVMAFSSQDQVIEYLNASRNIVGASVIEAMDPETFASWQALRVGLYWTLLWMTVGACITFAGTFLIPYDFRLRLPIGIAAIFFGGLIGGFMLAFSSIMEYNILPQPAQANPFGQQYNNGPQQQANTNTGFNNQYYNPNDPYGRPDSSKEIEVEVETNENKGN